MPLPNGLSKWRVLLASLFIVKITVMILTPPLGDLINWTADTKITLEYVTKGHFPPISVTGVYGPIELLLTPFYWIWTKLPVQHPLVHDMLYSQTTPALLLSALMKLPPLVADIITGYVLFTLTLRLTRSEKKGKLACLLWYANPYNIFWINAFGAMDVIPTLIFLLALVAGYSNKWFRAGICTSVASILRIYPLFTFPFFLPAIQSRKYRGHVFLGFLLPIIAVLIVLYASGAGTLNAIVQLPNAEYWLLDFLGGNLTNVSIRLALVLLPLQFYVVIRYWKKTALVYLATVSILALLIGAQNTPPHHFLWLSPLLTICVVLNPDETWIFILTFVTASLHLTPIFGLGVFPVAFFSLADPFFGGCFYAAKTTYLIKLNLMNAKA